MWPFSDMSLSAATLIGTIANWALLGCLVGGVFSTFAIVKTTDVKEEHWAEDRRQSAERIAALNRDTAKLSSDAESARAEIATAQKAAAEANQKAEAERLERLKLEARLAPRDLPDDALGPLVAVLEHFKGNRIDILAFAEGASSDTVPLASRIAEAFNKARWRAKYWRIISPTASVRGLVFSTREGAGPEVEGLADALVTTFRVALLSAIKWDQHFKTSDGKEIPGAGFNGPPWDENDVAKIRLFVGTKP